MAIEIPEDWPNRTWVEDTPLGHLVTIDSKAPGETEPTRWYVASWSTVREMTSSALPGQIRTRTGLSVGTGQARVKRENNDYPWKRRLVYALSGQDAQILLAPEGRTEIPTGQFRVAETSGNLTTLGVDVELDEKTIEGRDKAANVDGFSIADVDSMDPFSVDPSWLIAKLAEQMGYGTGSLTPGENGYEPLLDLPLQGSIAPAAPPETRYSTIEEIAWGQLGDSVALADTGANGVYTDLVYLTATALPASYVMTMDTVDSWTALRWDDRVSAGHLTVQIQTLEADDTMHLVVTSTGTNGTGNPSTSVDLGVVPRDPDNRYRVQIEVTLTAAAGLITSASVRVRRTLGAWSAPVVHTLTNGISETASYDARVTLGQVPGDDTAYLSHFSVVDGSSPSIDALLTTTEGSQGKIYLEPLYGSIISPWLDPELDVWGAMQAIVEAWQGALITDVYGDLRLLNRFTLAGIGTGAGQEEIVRIGQKFEDLPWVMDYNDQADRLVIKYRPVVTRITTNLNDSFPVVWEASEVIIVWPGYNEVFFTLDHVYAVDVEENPFVQKQFDNGIWHVWDAWRYNNGTGDHITPNDEIQMRIERVTSSTWKIVIRNLTAEPFHMVDETGQPYLKIRSSYWFDQRNEATVERGVSSPDARNAMEVDLSNYVQTEEDANSIADYLWGRANQRAWRAQTVNTIPDYRLDIGDVVEIEHERTGMRSNALVSKIEYAGEPGSLTQKLDLTLLPSTWEDFDEAWATANVTNPPATWNDFDALWDTYTWDDFDRTPTATTVAEIEEAM